MLDELPRVERQLLHVADADGQFALRPRILQRHHGNRHGLGDAARGRLRHNADADLAFDKPADGVEAAQLHPQAQRPPDAHRLAGEKALQGAGAIEPDEIVVENLFEADLGAYGGGLAGQIRVLSNTNALTEFLPEALSSFLAAHPHVSIDLEERLSDKIVGLIAEGVADLGVVAGTVDAGGLETYPFRRDRFVLVVAQDHALAKRAKVGFEDVLDQDFVGLDRASAIQRFLATKAVRIGRPLRLRVQLRSFDAICRLVECKVGIGIVPETTARRVSKTMAIKAVNLSDSWAVRDLTICVKSHAELPAYARQLVEHLRADTKIPQRGISTQ